jgi:hypothetical protein
MMVFQKRQAKLGFHHRAQKNPYLRARDIFGTAADVL